MSTPGKYASPQLRVTLREDAEGGLRVITQVAYSNSEQIARDRPAATLDEALEVIRQAWAVSAPGREDQ